MIPLHERIDDGFAPGSHERARGLLRDTPVEPMSARAVARVREIAVRLAAAEEEPPALKPGDGLGAYEVVRELGRGGQGVVHLARHRTTGAPFALKVPKRVLAHRLLREAQLAARLVHPHIVQTNDVQVDVPRPFLVMEYCPGGSLAERIRDGIFNGQKGLERAKDVAREVLEALVYVHEHGIVHRDVKPANILFDARARVRVCDIGIGKVTAAPVEEKPLDASVAPTGAPGASVTLLAGTPRYMAPEQEDPSLRVGGKIDGRADVFAFGKVLYEMLTGTPPRTVRPVSRVRDDVPEAWDDFIFRCVEERPEDRYPDAKAALAALRALPLRLGHDDIVRQVSRETRPPLPETLPDEVTRPPLWIPSLNTHQALHRVAEDGVSLPDPLVHVIDPELVPAAPRPRNQALVVGIVFLLALVLGFASALLR